jgi:uncharacterized protein
MLKVKKTKKMGRGVFAKAKIKKNTVVIEDFLLPFSLKDSDLIDNTDLVRYVYQYDKNTSCVALGLGSLLNHSENPNCFFKIDKERDILTVKTSKVIKAGEQLFIDYGYNPLAPKEERQ